MTEVDELSDLVGLVRGQGIAIGVDDVPRIATVLHHTRAWPRERRVRALRTLLARSSAERERFDHIAPLLLPPRSAADAAHAPSAAPGASGGPGAPGAPGAPGSQAAPREPRSRWPVAAGGAAILAALALGLYAAWPPPEPAPPIAASAGGVTPPPELGAGQGSGAPSAGDTRRIAAPQPSSLPGTLRGIAEGCGVATLLLAAWSLLARRSLRRHHAAVDRLARSSGRRVVGLAVDRSALHPIDRRAIASLAYRLAAPVLVDPETTLDPEATVEQTARNAGRLTLCFEREREQPPLILLEDVSRSMERWPAHADQLARALEAQGQPVDRRFIAGDPLHVSDRPSLGGPAVRLEDAAAGARVVIVSDGAHFDHEPARTRRHARALEGAIWLAPRPGALWRSGARWLDGRVSAAPLGAEPGSLAQPTGAAPAWRPPRPHADVHETADAWRSALTADAYFAFAATALLDLAASWTAALVWALVSDGVLAPPWQAFERIWDLPELAVLPGGRIRLAPALRDRLLADVRRERPELLAGVARWIDARLAAEIAAAGDGSMGATVGEVYRDRVARAAGLDGSGARVRQLARRGLSAVVAAHLGEEERAAWGVRDPHASLLTRLRGPMLGLALLATAGFGVASVVVKPWREVSREVPIDAGAIDTAIDRALDAAAAPPTDSAAEVVQLADPVVRLQPRIRSVEPNHAVPGARVRIRGEHLTASRFAVATFGKDEPMTLQISSDTEVIVEVPEDIPAGPTTILVKFGDAQWSSQFELLFTVDPRRSSPDRATPDTGPLHTAPSTPSDATAGKPHKPLDQVIYFPYGRSDIPASAYPLLDEVAAEIKGDPSIQQVEIQGHTDERGTKAYQIGLSARCAEAVEAYLVDKGVDEKRLVIRTYGPAQPVDPGHDEAAWAKNRRVQFRILKRKLKD